VMRRLYALGAGLPSSFSSETVASLGARLVSPSQEFSLEKGRGVLSKFTYPIESVHALVVTYAFVEESETVVRLEPEKVLEIIQGTGRIPQEQKKIRPRMSILECMLLKDKGLALMTKHFGRLKIATVYDSALAIVDALGKKPSDVVEYGRGPSPKETWIRHGLRFLNHLASRFSRQEVKVLRVGHKKGTREHVTKDVTDLIRDVEFNEALMVLGLTRQNTVEVEIDWYQDSASRLKLGMKFDYRRGIAFHSNVMDYESSEQRAAILDRFAEEYQDGVGVSWTNLLYGETLPYYFGDMTRPVPAR